MIATETTPDPEQTQQVVSEAVSARVRALPAWLPFVLVLATILTISLLSLMRVVVPFVDEGWNANRAWALLHTGRPFGTMDAGVFEHYPGYWTYFPLLGTAIHSLAIALLGPTLSTMRTVSFLFGALVLVIVYLTGTRLYDRRVGTVAVVLASFITAFVFAWDLGRHDIIVAALGYGALLLYLLDDPPGFPYRSFLAGFAIGLTPDIHLNGIIFAPAVAALYILEYGWRFVAKPRFLAFAGGGLLGVAWFVAVHIIPYPQTFFALFSIGNGGGRTPPVLDSFWFVKSIGQAFSMLGPVMAILTVLALARLLYKRTPSDTRLLVFFCALVLAFAGIIRGKPLFYGALLAPAAGLLVAAFMLKLWDFNWSSRPAKLLANGLAWGLAASSCAVTLLPMLFTSPTDFDQLLMKIRAEVPATATVLGAQTYYYALPDQRYLSWEQIVYYRRDTPGSTLEDALRALHPDYLLIDNFVLGALLDDSAATGKPAGFLTIPKAEFDSFVQKYATLHTIPSDTMGEIRLYKINWPAQGALTRSMPMRSGFGWKLQ